MYLIQYKRFQIEFQTIPKMLSNSIDFFFFIWTKRLIITWIHYLLNIKAANPIIFCPNDVKIARKYDIGQQRQ